ncbi:MAG: Fic family protein [Rhizobiales bacterium]|nr:Fic family protein [Hyphomicrobiales bacterium]
MASNEEIQEQIDRLYTLILSEDSGLLTDEIEKRTKLGLNRRTLNRRLDALVQQNLIEKVGKGRLTRYMPISSAQQVFTKEKQETELESQPDLFVPLSKSGGKVFKIVSGPLGSRRPVAYNRDFLENYQPNKSSFLTAGEKAKLLEMGRTADAEHEAGTYALQILNRLLIELSWNSSRLEGNTYSLLETQRLIELGHSVEDKAPRDAQMLLNHKAAIEFIVQSARDIGFNRMTILNLHALLADNLLADPGAAGRIRQEAVGISGSVYMPPEVPQIIEECFDMFLEKARAIIDPFEQAFFVMVQLPYLQPFIDVNKRVSRLAMNIPFIRNNLAPMSFIGMPDQTYTQGLLGVYELNRIELIRDVFLWAYEKSSARYVAVRQTIGEPDTFRLRYRQALKQIVTDVIHSSLDQAQAAKHIAKWSEENISDEDRAKFIESAESEILSLHEGNFARYAVTPRQFEAWQSIWKKA